MGHIIRVLLLCCNLLQAAGLFSRPLRAGIYQNPPKIYTGRDGRPAGIFADILMEAAAINNWKITWVTGSWNTLLQKLDSGEIDLLPDLSHSLERAKKYRLSGIPVIQSWVQIFAPRRLELHSLSDLSNRRIAVLADSIQDRYLQQRLNELHPGLVIIPVRCPDYSSAITLIRKNRADAIAADRFFYFSPERPPEFIPLQIPLFPGNIHIAFSARVPQQLSARLDKTLLELKNTPESVYYQTMLRHLNFHYYKQDTAFPGSGWILAVGAAVCFALISLLLRRQLKKKSGQLHTGRVKLQQALQDRELLIRELFHRTHNTLQLLASLSRMQQRGTDDMQIAAAFDAFRRRMDTLTVIHRRLLLEQDLSAIDLSAVIRKVAASVLQDAPKTPRVHFDLQPVKVQLEDAVPAGTVVQELLSNSLNHAWPEGTPGEITVTLHAIAAEQITLTYRDNGCGFNTVAPRNAGQLGLSLIESITQQQLQGSLVLTSGPAGMEAVITFLCRKESGLNSAGNL